MTENASLDESQGGFDVFRKRAQDPRAELSDPWLVGFDSEWRTGFEDTIATSIFEVLENYVPGMPSQGDFLVDIGAGASDLTTVLTDACGERGLTHVVVDSDEMLSHIDSAEVIKVPGRFPDCVAEIEAVAPEAKYFLSYSVMQYVLRDNLWREFVTSLMRLMPQGSIALLGDIPNRSMRNRQRVAANLDPEDVGTTDISDQLMLEVLALVRESGCHGYVLPQNPSLPLSAHREDFVIVKPGDYVKREGN